MQSKAHQTIPVYEGPETTSFGIFGTSPESPDGKRICYTRYPHFPSKGETKAAEGELWVCDQNLSSHRKLVNLIVKPLHNGTRAFWVDNDQIAYSSNREIFVVDAASGETLLGPYRGDLGHDAYDHRLLFWDLSQGEREPGPYELDADSGQLRLLVQVAEIRECVEKGLERKISDFTAKHLAFSKDGSLIGFRLHGELENMLTFRPDGSELRLYPTKKPMHQLWYDGNTIMGVWRKGPEGKIRHFYRWSLEGEVLEELAGSVSHAAASPDRQWFAGETCDYFKQPVEMALYRRGETEPVATFFKHPYADITWNQRFHVNPAFSRDGKRLYFWEATREDKVEARFADLSSIES